MPVFLCHHFIVVYAHGKHWTCGIPFYCMLIHVYIRACLSLYERVKDEVRGLVEGIWLVFAVCVFVMCGQ